MFRRESNYNLHQAINADNYLELLKTFDIKLFVTEQEVIDKNPYWFEPNANALENLEWYKDLQRIFYDYLENLNFRAEDKLYLSAFLKLYPFSVKEKRIFWRINSLDGKAGYLTKYMIKKATHAGINEKLISAYYHKKKEYTEIKKTKHNLPKEFKTEFDKLKDDSVERPYKFQIHEMSHKVINAKKQIENDLSMIMFKILKCFLHKNTRDEKIKTLLQ